jgi:cation diffusion facilitator CzcD-associated flavoprotein CzcO
MMARVHDARVIIVGAGFGGLGAAIRLREAGIGDVVVLERAPELGGTWSANTYPGCACDVPSHLYSFSFAPNPEWSRFFAPQSEILAYLQRVARERAVAELIRFDSEVVSAVWVEDEARWVVRTARDETFRAPVLIAASGPLSEPARPDVPGLDTFEGTIFHSAQWDHSWSPRGRRVAVIGTGASAAQFIPHLQQEAAALTVFQRTAPWVMPRPDFEQPQWLRRALRRVPALQRVLRTGIYYFAESLVYGLTKDQRALRPNEAIARWHLRRQVPDPELRAKLTPSYRLGCKRIIFANDFSSALAQDNVEVVTEGIREVVADGIVTVDGRKIEVDAIVMGTGFRIWRNPLAERTVGRGGRTLAEAWKGGLDPVAYRGTVVSGFPNHFLVIGPNTALGNNSMINIIEAQLVFIVDALRAMKREGLATVDVRPEAQDRWNAWLQEQLRGTVWNRGGCRSWYLTPGGVNRTLWPTYSNRFREALRGFTPADFAVERVREAPLAA